MAVIRYARASVVEEDLSVQKAALRAAGCSVIRVEKRSGATMTRRKQLRTVLELLRGGDVLTVTRLDRLAQSIATSSTWYGRSRPGARS